MLVADLLSYWYGTEIPKAPRRLHGLILVIADAFSMPLLLRTLFAPWRKDVIPTAGFALPEKIRALGYNLVAVLIGFTVRTFVLFVGSLAVAFSLLGGAIFIGVWFAWPFLPIVFFLVGIVLIFR